MKRIIKETRGIIEPSCKPIKSEYYGEDDAYDSLPDSPEDYYMEQLGMYHRSGYNDYEAQPEAFDDTFMQYQHQFPTKQKLYDYLKSYLNEFGFDILDTVLANS